MLKKIGILGGTFDPIHNAHLALARHAKQDLALDEVWFIPASVPPHKQQARITSGTERLEMVRLAIADEPLFVVSDVEVSRGGLSFTVETLRALHRQRPEVEWYLIIGSDSLREFATWRAPDEIARLSKIVVAPRSGQESFDLGQLSPPLTANQVEDIRGRMLHERTPAISSREIRTRIHNREPVDELAPAPVIEYIRRHGLYQ